MAIVYTLTPVQVQIGRSWRALIRSRLISALEEDLGETRIVGQGLLDRPPWTWPER